jgi:hypothetical protein
VVIVQDSCPFEGPYGQIGFLLCSDHQTIVLMCDECNRIWLHPERLEADHALFAEPPDFLVPDFECSIRAPLSRWATRAEIELYGWSTFIQGDGKALDED